MNNNVRAHTSLGVVTKDKRQLAIEFKINFIKAQLNKLFNLNFEDNCEVPPVFC